MLSRLFFKLLYIISSFKIIKIKQQLEGDTLYTSNLIIRWMMPVTSRWLTLSLATTSVLLNWRDSMDYFNIHLMKSVKSKPIPKKAGELWKVQTNMKWSDRKIKH